MKYMTQESLFHRVLQVQKGDCADASKLTVSKYCFTKIPHFNVPQLKERVGIGSGVVSQLLALLANLIESIFATLHFVQSLTTVMDLQYINPKPTIVFANFMKICIVPKITNLSTLDWEIASVYSTVIVSFFGVFSYICLDT